MALTTRQRERKRRKEESRHIPKCYLRTRIQNCEIILIFFFVCLSVFSLHSAVNLHSFINRKNQMFFNGRVLLPCHLYPPPQAGECVLVLKELHPNSMILSNWKSDRNIQNRVQYTEVQAGRLQKKNQTKITENYQLQRSESFPVVCFSNERVYKSIMTVIPRPVYFREFRTGFYESVLGWQVCACVYVNMCV